ncbi:MAG: hypothetical protein PF437_10620 [Sulfurimonas sp.]|nr:hypothetical protein [Sulfurimonas sp.]
MKRSIKIITIVELLIIASSLISFSFFINLQVAFLSSLFIILGSSYAYKKMVNTQVSSDMLEEKRDVLDTIEDPHELYEEDSINYAPVEELDLKAIVKQEKKKIKTFSLESMKHGVKGSSSLFRLVPYLFLVLEFIALKNNELLDIAIYLPSLLVGIVVGSISGKELFSVKE